MAVNGALSQRSSRPGFYYKTFIGPQGAWERLYEPAIRRAAGLGVAPTRARRRPLRLSSIAIAKSRSSAPARRASPPRCGRRAQRRPGHPVRRAGGIRRLAARRRAGDDRRQAGGRVGRGDASPNCAALPNVTLLPRTQVFGYYAQNFLAAEQRVTDHLAYPDPQAAARAALAGAREAGDRRDRRARAAAGVSRQRPARHHARRFRARRSRSATASSPGARVVVATTHDGGYRAALDLADAGCEIAMIVDLRAEADGALPTAARARGAAGRDARGDPRLARRLARHARAGGAAMVGRRGRASRTTIACDLIAMTGGWTPSVHLFSQSRGKLEFDAATQTFLPGAPAQNMICVGACAGVFDLAQALADGAARRGRRGRARRRRASRARDRVGGGTLGLVAPLRGGEAQPRRSSISRTTSPRATSSSRRARACARSSTSSATPRPAWRPIRARPPT